MNIGIDLGGTKIEGILIDDKGREIKRLRRPTQQVKGYQAIVNNIGDIVGFLDQSAGKPCRVGIGTPGKVTAEGLITNSNTTCLNGRPLKSDLEFSLKRKIRIANDANCFTLSEAVDGAAAGYRTVFGIIMGTGVGGGIVIDRQIIEGRHKITGEWGHNQLLTDGPPCYCGRCGCVETLISGPGLVNDWIFNGGDPHMESTDIVELASHGNALAELVMQRFIDHFARALAVVINILDPDCVVLGGGMSNIDQLYLEGRDRLQKFVFSDTFTTPILRNHHGDSSGVRGASWL